MNKNWEIKTLGEVCEKTQNLSWANFPNDSFEYIDLTSVSRHDFTISSSVKVNATNAPSRAKKIVADGDIIFGTTRPTLRRIAKVIEKYDGQLCSTGFAVLRGRQNLIVSDYIFYFLQTETFNDRMEKIQRGTSYPAVTDSDVKDTQISLPPLVEQKRIVKILDKKFGAIEELKKVTERQIVDAKELFESRLNEVFEKPSSEFVSKQLNNLIKIKHGFAFKSQWFCKSGEFVLLTPGNFYEEGGYRDRADKQKFYCGSVPQDYVLAQNDLLVAMTEQAKGLLGSPILVPESNKFLHNQRLGLAQFISDSLHYKYLYYYFNTIKLRESLFNSGTGVKVRHTSPEKITRNFINLPSLREQGQIAKELDALSEKTKELEAIFRRKIADLEELKKSYLEQAFAGKL